MRGRRVVWCTYRCIWMSGCVDWRQVWHGDSGGMGKGAGVMRAFPPRVKSDRDTRG
jgi:hypothetical protein